MPGMEGLGRMLLFLGSFLALLGLLMLLVGRLPYLGKLPGDLVLRREGLTIYFPMVTGLLLSLALTLVLNLALWVLRR